MFKEASYLKLFENGQLLKKVEKAKEHIENCKLCPHNCGVNRKEELGICKGSDKAIVASYGPHFGEEGVLVGNNGSGTIFFGYCNMSCVYCQNYDISFYGKGEIVTNEELSNIMISLQNRGCSNINLVTPTHYVFNILEAIYLAAKKGLKLPIVYNTGGYEKLETLKILDGVIDIYMPDFKYILDESGEKYSKVKKYPKIIKESLLEMDRQVGGIKLDDKGLAYRGLLIRHLMIPGKNEETKKILKFIKDELSKGVLVNLMDQYYPSHNAYKYEELTRRIDSKEYREAFKYAKKLGLNLV